MPWREMTREQGWLLPPTLDDLLTDGHPARFVAAFVDGLTQAEWAELGVNMEGEALGAPAYHPRALLCVWLYGFMTGVRSSRKLEGACRDQIPYLWLSGWQHPDHNTLWRFYQAHRPHLRSLLRQTVRTAVRLDLVDWAVQAVDGTKVAGDAATERTYGQEALEGLLARTEAAILDLEAQNEGGDDPPPPNLPKELRQVQRLRERVLEARRSLEERGKARVNLTDPDAGFMRGAHGYVLGYNAQAMAAPVKGGGGMLITAAEVTQDPVDNGQLVPLIEAARDNTMDNTDESSSHPIPLTLADTGYFSGANLTACEEQGLAVAMPENQPHTAHPYHKDRFTYDPSTDTYTCPKGQTLAFSHIAKRKSKEPVRVYRPPRSACRLCPAMGICTKNQTHGRLLEVTLHDQALREHRRWMETPQAQTAFKRRKGLIEPVFGILKEQMGARRFLLRGLAAVQGEWSLLAAAFNLRSLWKAGRRPTGGPSPSVFPSAFPRSLPAIS